MNREKVIQGLEHCGFGALRGCDGCPYGDECATFGRDAGTSSLSTDALALIREQEKLIDEFRNKQLKECEERIKQLESDLRILTWRRMNNGAFD